MTFEVLDTRNRTDFERSNMATMFAIRGKQFGREVYSSILKFKDLADFLEVFPDVQRDVLPRRVSSLRRYILSGLEKGDELNLRFFSAVTVTCKGHIYYDDKNTHMAVDTNHTKLSINDGQHRFHAIKTALELLEKQYVSSKDKERSIRLASMIEELSEMTIPVVIFNGLSETEEKQLFYDLNNLQQRPSRNINIKLNQVDIYSKMAREIAEESRYLKHYGVEYQKMSIHKNNPNTILLTTVLNSIKELLGYEYKHDKKFLTEENFDEVKKSTLERLEKILGALPHDMNVKGKYLLEKNYAFKGITRFVCDATTQLEFMLSEEDVLSILKDSDFTQVNVDQWINYGGIVSESGNLVFGGGQNGGFRAIYNMLMDKAILYKEKENLVDSGK